MNAKSPHPGKRKKRLWIIALVLILALLGSLSWWRNSKTATISYREVTVNRGDLDISILATGVVQPENRLEIKSPVSGRAEDVLVDEGRIVKKGQTLVWMSSTERAALLDAARARGAEELKSFEEYYKPTPVLAPISGTIIRRNIQPGQTFTTSDAILVMSDHLTIQAQVDETDISRIRLKQEAEITLDAYPNDPIPGYVDKIAYDAKTVNNVTTYIVDVMPRKIPPFMRSGMTANVSFLTESRQGILLVPTEALKVRAEKANYVLLKSADGKEPVERIIKIGLTDGKRTEVASGLNEGDIVLVPQLKLGGKGGNGTNPFAPFGGKGGPGRKTR